LIGGGLGRLWQLVAPHRWLLGAVVAAGVLSSLLDSFTLVALVPLLRQLFGTSGPLAAGNSALERWVEQAFRPLLDGTTADQALARVGLLLVAVLVLKNLAGYVARILETRVQERVVADVRRRTFRHLLGLDLDFHRRSRTGELVNMVMQEAEAVKRAATTTLVSLARNSVLVIGTVAVLLSISPRLTLLAVSVVPLAALVVRLLSRRLKHHTRARTAERAALAGHASERLSSIRLLRVSGTQAAEAERFDQWAARYARRVERTTRYAALMSPVAEVSGTFAVMLILFAGVHPETLGLVEPISPQALIVFLVAALRLTSPFKALSSVQSELAQSLASFERIAALLARAPAEVDPPGAREATFARDLVFDDVSFAYPGGPPVLRHVSFRLERGRTVALVGPSGGGKSTLADLVPRLHDPTEGAVRFDGVPSTECSRVSVRRLVAFVSQETLILHDTVHANIAYGSGEVGRDAVEAAARAANAHDFIVQLPQGYDTVLGERGSRLSGGQRQRVAIARALLRDAPILVLDEATSSLDTESERLVQEAIDRLMAGRAVLVIAHRLATVRRADEILVLQEGRVVQRGTHAALLAEGGTYRRLHDLQLSDDVIEPELVEGSRG
jgi:subfamily B ATP-binding cassette protein MsbA